MAVPARQAPLRNLYELVNDGGCVLPFRGMETTRLCSFISRCLANVVRYLNPQPSHVSALDSLNLRMARAHVKVGSMCLKKPSIVSSQAVAWLVWSHCSMCVVKVGAGMVSKCGGHKRGLLWTLPATTSAVQPSFSIMASKWYTSILCLTDLSPSCTG